MPKVCVGIIAGRDAAGNFLPARPIYRDIEDEKVNKDTGMTKEEEKNCDTFANAMARYINECRKAGVKPFEGR